MKCTARLMAATVGLTLGLASTLYADDAVKPKARVDADRFSTSDRLSDPAPALSLIDWAPQAESRPAPAGSAHSWDESGSATPRVEWFLGYSFWRAMPASDSNRMGYLHGGSTSVAFNFNRYFGLVADFGGYANSKVTLFSPTGSQTFDANGRAYTYMFGPRFSYRRYEHFTPFFEALFGGAHASTVTISGCTADPSCTPLPSENAFAGLLGVGFDIKITRHVALRLIEGDFLATRFHDPFAANIDARDWQKNVRLSSGLVFRFGGNPAPAPPAREPMSATCSADKEMVYVDSGDVVAVHVQAGSSEKYPVNYSWSASDGVVDGSGSDVRWSSAGHRTGVYVVKVRVENGRHGSADCSVNIRVEPRPNRNPTLSCAADRSTVTVGETAGIMATASDPDNDALTFAWTASGGIVDGSGSSVKFRTGDLGPGPYTVSGHVDDARGGTADCTVRVQVEAARIPAEVTELEARLALHSIYFATARPTVSNPTGGLVESQQNVLLALARDFNRYLTFKPQAHLILQGHADHRGSEEYNKALTERRVDRTKSFLAEHGVPAGNVETQARGEDDNLSAEQVKQLIEQNPELSNEERQRLMHNLAVIVLANNRRVDVTLNTTGQQSVRQYPFNAKDALTLLSPAGTDGNKLTRTSRRPRTKVTRP
ncbi:MAG: OmpA family protein [Acidobacteriota bacterium]|nr:OmpA family protein [Acidobacteriota bacterium]